MVGEVLVLGAEGLLGATLCPRLKSMGWSVVRQSRRSGADLLCDPSSTSSLRSALKGLELSAIINLIAISDVDYCESHMMEAYLAHVRTVEVLASVIKEIENPPHLIQISTDQLYSGPGPHLEEAALPMNAYAMTKLAGELAALQVGATVLRTNFFGRSQNAQRNSFTDWLYHSLVVNEPFTVFNDVLISALKMETLAECISIAVEARCAGVYNVGTRHGLSKAHFAQLFANELGLNTSNMVIGSTKDVKLLAPRPNDMRMDVSAFEFAFGIKMPSLSEQISEVAVEYRGN